MKTIDDAQIIVDVRDKISNILRSKQLTDQEKIQQLKSEFKPYLKSIAMSMGRIKEDEMRVLVEALKISTDITTFNIGDSSIGPEGAKLLAKFLETNQTLRNLNVTANQIGDEGAKALAEVLKTNTTLTNLNLRFNQITAEAVKEIAEILKANETLTIEFQAEYGQPNNLEEIYKSHRIAHKLIESMPGLEKESKIGVEEKGANPTYKFLKSLKEFEVSMDKVVDAIMEIQDEKQKKDRRKEIIQNIYEYLGVANEDEATFLPLDDKEAISSTRTLLGFALYKQKQKEIEFTTNNMLGGVNLELETIDIDILEGAVRDLLDLTKNPAGKIVNYLGKEMGRHKERIHTQSNSLEDRLDYLDKSNIKGHPEFDSTIEPLIKVAKSNTPNSSTRKSSSIAVLPSTQNQQ